MITATDPVISFQREQPIVIYLFWDDIKLKYICNVTIRIKMVHFEQQAYNIRVTVKLKMYFLHEIYGLQVVYLSISLSTDLALKIKHNKNKMAESPWSKLAQYSIALWRSLHDI